MINSKKASHVDVEKGEPHVPTKRELEPGRIVALAAFFACIQLSACKNMCSYLRFVVVFKGR